MLTYGKYGRYIGRLFMLVDFIVVNIAYLAVWWLNPGVSVWHTRLTWLLMAVSFMGATRWLMPLGSVRPMLMERLVRNTLLAGLAHIVVFIVLMYIMGDDDVPWQVLLEFSAIDMVSLVCWRIAGHWLLKVYRRRGGNKLNVVIVGCRDTAQRLYSAMTQDEGFGYAVKGFYDVYCPPGFRHKRQYRGTVDDLEAWIGQGNRLDELYYTLSGEDGPTLQRLVGLCDRNMVRFHFVPQLSPYLARSLQPRNIGPVAVLGIRRHPLDNPVNTALKRAFDIVFSGVFLLFSPLVFIPVAIAVKLSSPGPVFFRQLRTGFKGEDFYCLKFRTMRVNAQADTLQATRHDPRKTRVGEFLRRTSLDELPQFINVFLGDMSIVGPRPHMLKHTHDYSRLLEMYMVRHFIKPGITGWAQVCGYRGQTDELWQMQRRVEHDIWYMENWTFLLDLKIVARTVLGVLSKDDNAF